MYCEQNSFSHVDAKIIQSCQVTIGWKEGTPDMLYENLCFFVIILYWIKSDGVFTD